MIILTGSNYSVLAGLNQQNEHMNEPYLYKNEQIEHTILITVFILHFIKGLVDCDFIFLKSVSV